jgi:catechol 2,3-dioxygenase-like lactoylglutathione lyase family enzyme
MTPLLQVFDMRTSIAFYRNLIGFEIVATSHPGDDFTWAMLKLGESLLMLNTAYDEGERPAEPDPTRVASHADTALFFHCADADEFFAHLQRHGWPVQEPHLAPYGMRQVYTRDPDGYEICFQHPA